MNRLERFLNTIRNFGLPDARRENELRDEELTRGREDKEDPLTRIAEAAREDLERGIRGKSKF